ncbi:MAG: hypothetical protein ACI9GO_000706 [Bacteroidia bacterium]|jgi:hypothetical protein
MKVTRLLTIVALLFLCRYAEAQQRIKGELFDYFKVENENPRIMVFLHGSVAYYAQNQQDQEITISQLLEGNEDFLEAFMDYTIIIPIAHEGFNWLKDSAVLKLFKGIPELESRKINVICGFSDGGTGAYRMFYEETDKIESLIVFNGYPQHNNYNKKVDYSIGRGNRGVIFCSTYKDKIVPYEFLLLEYKKIRSTQPFTYMYITEGRHVFSAYDLADFKAVKELKSASLKMVRQKTSYLLDGLIANDSIYQAYYFRRRIGKKYGVKKEFLALKPTRKEINWINRAIRSKTRELKITQGGEMGEIRGNLIFSNGKKSVNISVANPFVDPDTMKNANVERGQEDE